MRRINVRITAIFLSATLCGMLALSPANAGGGCGGGGGGGGGKVDNRTPGQKAMDKRSKDNPNRNRSKNGPAGDPGLRPGNGPVSNGPYSNGQNGSF